MTRWTGRLGPRRLAGARDGAVAAEFAIVIPIFFLFLFGIFDFARVCWVVNTLQVVLSQGTRYVMTTPGSNSKPTAGNCATWSGAATYQTNIQTYLQTQLTGLLSSAAGVVPTAPTADCGTSPRTVTVTLRATYQFNFLGNLVPLAPITLQQQATVTAPLI